MIIQKKEFTKIRHGDLLQKNCPCGQIFFTDNPSAIYHSTSCKQIHYMRRRMSKEAQNYTEENFENVNENENPNSDMNDSTVTQLLQLTRENTALSTSMQMKEQIIAQLTEKNSEKNKQIEFLNSTVSQLQKDQEQKVKILEQALADVRQKLLKVETNYRVIEGDFYKLEADYERAQSDLDLVSDRLLTSEESNQTLRKQLISSNVTSLVLLHAIEGKNKVDYKTLEAVLKESGLLKKSESDDFNIGPFQVTRPANGEFFSISKLKK